MYGDCSKNPRLELFVSQVLLQYIPDVHLLLAVRSRYRRQINVSCSIFLLLNSSFRYMHQHDENADKAFRVCVQRNENILLVVLQIIECFLTTVPTTFAHEKFDILRLLDDLIPWNPAHSALEASKEVQQIDALLVSAAVRVASLATNMSLVHWFSSRDDVVKVITNLMFTNPWIGVVRRSALAKLMLLSVVESDVKAGKLLLIDI